MMHNTMRILLLFILSEICASFSHQATSHRESNMNIVPHVNANDADRNRPNSNVVVISTPDEYVQFLNEDDQLCVIKFYAAWCKSCAKFGIKYNKLANDYTNSSNAVRFAEVEYNTNRMLCKTLKVRSLPTVHMYKRGRGKVAQMTKKPSEFHDVIDEIDRLLRLDDDEVEASSNVEETYKIMGMSNNATDSTMQFEQRMVEGGRLSEEIMMQIKKQEASDGKVKKDIMAKEKKDWFTFPFTFF